MMWCAECQLDAPALAVPEEPGVIRCAYCRGEMTGRRQDEQPQLAQRDDRQLHQPSDAATVAAQNVADDVRESIPLFGFVPPPPIDDWEADTELRRVERVVAVVRQAHDRGDDSARAAPSSVPIAEARRDSGDCTPRSEKQQPEVAPPTEKSGLMAWTCLTLGLMAFVCGGVLVGWSFVADRGDLWSLGLPLTLAGQVGLVLGLLLQLDGLSQSTRRTEKTLTDLDGQLGQLREVTALVSATHSAPAQSFYAHLSDGASPQILLADLKGQLDLLAQQMARQRKVA